MTWFIQMTQITQKGLLLKPKTTNQKPELQLSVVTALSVISISGSPLKLSLAR
jgi:hypothetical protein